MFYTEVVIEGDVYLTKPESYRCDGCAFNLCGDAESMRKCDIAYDILDCEKYEIIFVKKIDEPKHPDKTEWKVAMTPSTQTPATIELTKQEIKAAFLSWDKESDESRANEFVDHVLKTKGDFAQYLKLKEQFKGL